MCEAENGNTHVTSPPSLLCRLALPHSRTILSSATVSSIDLCMCVSVCVCVCVCARAGVTCLQGRGGWLKVEGEHMCGKQVA